VNGRLPSFCFELFGLRKQSINHVSARDICMDCNTSLTLTTLSKLLLDRRADPSKRHQLLSFSAVDSAHAKCTIDNSLVPAKFRCRIALEFYDLYRGLIPSLAVLDGTLVRIWFSDLALRVRLLSLPILRRALIRVRLYGLGLFGFGLLLRLALLVRLPNLTESTEEERFARV
jgi:hypothetical protein